jgi:C4-dicarboxylate-specific signal transduction histidine kinase
VNHEIEQRRADGGMEREKLALSEQALHRLRSKLAHVETIESLDVVTASIAFELRQSLCGIVTNANACLRMLAADPPKFESARETMRRTIRDSNRALEVVTRFTTLFGSEDATTESVDLNEAAREVLALLSSELEDASVSVRIEFAQDLPLVASNRVQLQQAILNLARNALDAMRTVNDRPGELLVRSELDGHDAVRLTLTDTGVGPGASFSFSLPSRPGP